MAGDETNQQEEGSDVVHGEFEDFAHYSTKFGEDEEGHPTATTEVTFRGGLDVIKVINLTRQILSEIEGDDLTSAVGMIEDAKSNGQKVKEDEELLSTVRSMATENYKKEAIFDLSESDISVSALAPVLLGGMTDMLNSVNYSACFRRIVLVTKAGLLTKIAGTNSPYSGPMNTAAETLGFSYNPSFVAVGTIEEAHDFLGI